MNPDTLRIPPQAIEVEKHIIGAMSIDADAAAVAIGSLSPSDFYFAKHETIFEAMASLAAKNLPVDWLTVTDELTKAGKYAQVGDAYIVEIAAEVVSAADIESHCRIIKEKSLLRSLIKTASTILTNAYDARIEARSILEDAEREVFALGDAQVQDVGLRGLRECMLEAAQEWQAVAEGKPGGIMSSVMAVDDFIRGFRPGTLNVVAARPGVGKSALTLQIAAQCGAPVALYSLEMLALEQVERLIAQRVDGIDGDALRSPSVLKAKAAALSVAMAELAGTPVRICDSSSMNPAKILAQCRRMKKKHGLGLIIVDYLQLVEAIGNHQRRDLEVGSVSAALKKIGNELGVPILAVASLSRKCEDREDKRPMKSDLRESGQLESDAHSIIFLYRESDYSVKAAKDPNVKNITEVLIRKNRGGRTGRSLLLFNGAQSKFMDLTPQSQKAYWSFLDGKSFQGEEGF